MSRLFNNKTAANNNSKGKVMPSKFCKVCRDLGKSKEEYESHYVRATPDPNAAVTCPVLLALECTYCGKSAHTVKYCKELAREKKEKERKARALENEEREQKLKQSSEKQAKTKKPVNIFSALSDQESESDNEEKKHMQTASKKQQPLVLVASKNKKVIPAPFKVEEDFPALSQKSSSTTKVNTMNFSAIVTQVKEREELEQEEAALLAKLAEINKLKQSAVAQQEKPKTIKAVFLPKKQEKEQERPKQQNIAVAVAVSVADAASEYSMPTHTSKSLFDRSEYISDNDDYEEEEQEESFVFGAKGSVVYDAAEFDEDW